MVNCPGILEKNVLEMSWDLVQLQVYEPCPRYCSPILVQQLHRFHMFYVGLFHKTLPMWIRENPSPATDSCRTARTPLCPPVQAVRPYSLPFFPPVPEEEPAKSGT